MKTPTFARRMLSAAAAFVVCGGTAAVAFPVNGLYLEDSRCDPLANRTLSHELGDQLTFPANQSIKFVISPTQTTICAPNDGIANDWVIQMTNTSGQAWQDLFFVANLNNQVGNADGVVADLTNAAFLSDAFRIDGTVTPGANNSLAESGTPDEIFQPGETWRFLLTNFQNPTGVSPVPGFFTPGQFAGSASVTTPDQCSILANPYVPEPSFLGVIGVAAVALLSRRPRRG